MGILDGKKLLMTLGVARSEMPKNAQGQPVTLSDSTHFGYQTVDETEKARRVGGVFSSVAGKYDLMNDLMSGGLHRAWKAYTVMVANLREGQAVLDIAGGTGDLARAFAKKNLTDIREKMVGLDAAGRFEVTKNDADKMMFKVPSLRNVEKTAPYFFEYVEIGRKQR